MMNIDSFESDRDFKVWEYTVSMGLLLLRSVRSQSHATQVDLLFRVTSFVCLSTESAGLIVRTATPDEIEQFVREHGPVEEGSTLFRVNASEWVAARSLRAAETEDEYFAPSPLMADYSL